MTDEKDSRIVRSPRPVHECSLPAPNHHGLGTIAECPDCRRRWKMRKVGYTFKGWRLTVPALILDGPARQRWADVKRGATE